MKYEIERVEAMDRAREMEPISQTENQPPKIERAELSEDKEQPPKLDCSDIKLGGTVTEMMTEMKKQDILRMKEQSAIRNGNIHMKEDYEARKNGESSWYNYCMDQAAKCHVDGK